MIVLKIKKAVPEQWISVEIFLLQEWFKQANGVQFL